MLMVQLEVSYYTSLMMFTALLYLLLIDCQYQYVQEPLTALYCRYASTIQIGCSILSPSSLPSINTIQWFRSTGENLQEVFTPRNVGTQRQTNNTHRTVTVIVSVDTQQGVQYWCRPRLSNNTLLQPSQAIVIQSVTFFNGYTSCQANDVFSTVSNRCADNVSENVIVPSNTPTKNPSSDTKPSTNSSTADAIATTSTGQSSIYGTLTSIQVTSTNVPDTICHRKNLLGLQIIFLPILATTLVVIVIQLIIHIILVIKLKRANTAGKLKTHPAHIATEPGQPVNEPHRSENNSESFRESYVYILPNAAPYEYPQMSSSQISAGTDQPLDMYSIPRHYTLKEYAPLVKESMNTPNVYTSTLPATDNISLRTV